MSPRDDCQGCQPFSSSEEPVQNAQHNHGQCAATDQPVSVGFVAGEFEADVFGFAVFKFEGLGGGVDLCGCEFGVAKVGAHAGVVGAAGDEESRPGLCGEAWGGERHPVAVCCKVVLSPFELDR